MRNFLLGVYVAIALIVLVIDLFLAVLGDDSILLPFVHSMFWPVYLVWWLLRFTFTL